MEGLNNILNKISIDDIEKLKALLSIMPNNDQKEIVTLRVFAEEYKNIIGHNRSTNYLHSVTISLNYLTGYFGEQRAINSISLKDIESFLIYLQQKVKKGYVVYFRNLKAAFNKALDWEYIKENHFVKLKLPKKQRVHPVFIDEEQLEKILQQIDNSVVRDFVTIAFYTGMRLNEIVNLTWKNVDITNRIITVGDEDFETKGKNQRYIPISKEALTAILTERETKEAIPIGNSFVFTKTNGEKYTGDYFSKRFKRACRAADMDKTIHFHSLRHSFASSLAQKGVSIYAIKELLGHSSISTTEIYSHLNVDALRKAISVFDNPSFRLYQRKRNKN